MNAILAEVRHPDDPDRESAGYLLLKEDCISCGNCRNKLLNVLKVANSPIKNYFIVICPHCNDKSFKYLIEGKVYVNPIDGLYISRSETDSVDNIITNLMELKKC